MQFKIDRDELKKAVKSVMAATDNSKSALEICKQVQIEVSQNALILTTMDMETVLRCTVPVEVTSPGEVRVSAKTLSDVVEVLPKGEVLFMISGSNMLQIKAGRSALHLKIIVDGDFPPIPEYKDMSFIETEDFFLDMDNVSFACKKDGSGTELEGIYINNGEVASTDGNRLAVRRLKYSLPNVLIHYLNLSKIRKSFSSGKVGVYVEKNRMHFKQDSLVGTISLMAAKFPDYPRVIPSTPDPIMVKVNKASLTDSLKRVGSMIDPLRTTTTLEFASNELTIRAQSETTGAIEDSLEIESTGTLKIGMCTSFLSDAISKLVGDTINIELRGDRAPLVMRDEENIHVVMPRRL